MAPNRKKKKPANNPARGFATTSSASKVKVSDDAPSDTDNLVSATEGADLETTNDQNGHKEIPDKDLSELSPEELEAQLEESELQLLVEKYRPKSTKDSARYVSKLQTERRVLRGQSEQLPTSVWFSQGLLDFVLGHGELHSGNSPNPTRTTPSLPSLAVEDLTIKIWTLRRTLSDLGFMSDRIQEAIIHLLKDHGLLDRANANTNKEALWGLNECLEWLAAACDLEEMPDYDSHITPKIAQLEREAALQKENMALDNANISAEGSGNATSNIQKKGATTPKPKGKKIAVHDASDDDIAPHEQLGRFLELKTRLHNHRPDLTEPPPHRKKKGAQAKGAPETPLKEADPDSWRIIQKIRKLESDILFDKEDAHEQWADLRIRLIKDAAERKKVLGENIEPPKNADHVSSHPLQPQLFESTESKHVQSDDDETVGVGEFFSNLPEQIVNKSGTSGSVSTTINGASIMVRDFGKWAGMSPRRVFEEACKARDSGVKVSYDPMSTVSFSARHSLTVHWSRAQEMPPLESIGGVSWKGDSRTAHLEMTDMSTLDSMQSEAYISTVSLFILFVSSPKEERTYLRLPSVWRSLWDELTIERQRRLDKADRLELKELRKLVEDHSDETNVLDISLDASSLRSPTATTASIAFLSLHTIAEDMGHQLASLWAAKASNPAFQRMARSRMALPIWNYRDELLAAIESHQVIIICGETGCGKSTQVPSFLLEHELSNGRPCKIYCTEPRRISAISLARRVSEELGERRSDVGTTRSLVGYAIRLESHITPLTRLVYATTGIVMRMLEGSEDLSEITHLVLDEVHERSIDSDFLLIILRKLMRRRPSLKVILMSATVNAEHFSQYLGGCPVMNVPGRTFPVNTLYLEDAIEVTNYGDNNNSEGGGFPDEDYEADEEGETKQSTAANELVGYSTRTRNFLLQFNEYRIDYSLIVDLLATIATNGQYVEYSEAILVFLPGLAEIRKLNSMLSGHWCFLNWEIFALHSTIATEDQERAFIVPPPGIRKIVLATNIAETGITIPDITCVVDTGKHKEMRFDERRQLSRLVETFISRANAKQRRGRAGRVQNGLCFHLFTKARHDLLIAEQQTPEMLRLSLQDLALRVKICNLGGIEQTLAEALNPPLPKNIRRAIESLVDVKALTQQEELTHLGRQLAKLPLDVYLGKLILLSSICNCLDAGITIAALLTSKSPFSAPVESRSQAEVARLSFKKGDSDLLTLYTVYCAWKRSCQDTTMSEAQFCRKNYLNPQSLSNIEDLKGQLTTALIDAGFLVLNAVEKASLTRMRFYSRQRHFIILPLGSSRNSSNELITDSVIAWSFYPKLLARDGKGWRNVANTQSVSLHPTSVNKGARHPPKFLSFYSIMQSGNRALNAQETSAAEDIAIALVCGDSDFKLYSGTLTIDTPARLRFSFPDWKTALAFKILRGKLKDIITARIKHPRKEMSEDQQLWWKVWEDLFCKRENQT